MTTETLSSWTRYEAECGLNRPRTQSRAECVLSAPVLLFERGVTVTGVDFSTEIAKRRAGK